MQPQRLPFFIWLILLVPASQFCTLPAVAQTEDDYFPSELGTNDDEPQISLPERSQSPKAQLISRGIRKPSNDPLIRLSKEAVDTTTRRMLSTDQHTPWQMMHALLGLREDFQLLHNGEAIYGLDWITKGQVFDNEYWFEPTQFGGRAHPYSVPYAFEGHANQFLAILSMCGVDLNQEFGTSTGKVTMRGMIQNAQMTVSTKDEPTWTLWALSRYLPSSATWRNAAGESWSIEKLVQIQTSKPMRGAPCGGTHGLFALAHARNVYLRQGKPLRGVWLQAEWKIRQHITAARRMQNSNGTLSSNFFRGPKYDPDFNKRMASAGHILEFLMLALPQKELNERWVRRAIEATARDLLNNRKAFVKCSPLYHSVNALNIYLDRVNPREKPAQHVAQVPRPADGGAELKSVPATQISIGREKPTETPESSDVEDTVVAQMEPARTSVDLPPAEASESHTLKAVPEIKPAPNVVSANDGTNQKWSSTPEERRTPIMVPDSKVNAEPIVALDEAVETPVEDSTAVTVTPVEAEDESQPDEKMSDSAQSEYDTDDAVVDLTEEGGIPAQTVSVSRESSPVSVAEPEPVATTDVDSAAETTEEIANTTDSEMLQLDTDGTSTSSEAVEEGTTDVDATESGLPEKDVNIDTEKEKVPGGINQSFLDPNLAPDEWVKRFEIESREVYAGRHAIVDALELTDGMKVADVGAGTGLFVGMLAKTVGTTGRVFAIDISPRFVDFMERRIQAEELSNVSVVRNDVKSLELGSEKVDRVLICDTYHHFEFPEEMLASIMSALAPGGEVVLVDFNRVPGESRDWVLQHVRAGRDTFKTEFEAAGFKYLGQTAVPAFDENYLLRFRKPIEN